MTTPTKTPDPKPLEPAEIDKLTAEAEELDTPRLVAVGAGDVEVRLRGRNPMTTDPRITKAGHDAEALSLLVSVLADHVDEPLAVACEIFVTLHDCGIRFAPKDQIR